MKKIVLLSLFVSLLYIDNVKAIELNRWTALALSPSIFGVLLLKPFESRISVSIFGDKPLSKKLSSKVRTILEKSGLSNWETISLLKMYKSIADDQTQPTVSGSDVIWFNEVECKKYSDKELEFIVMHEAMHIFNENNKKAMLLHFMAPISIYTGMELLRRGSISFCNFYSPESISLDRLEAVSSILSFATFSLLLSKIFKLSEMQADTQSIKKIGSADGAIEFFTRMKKETFETDSGLCLGFSASYTDRLENAKKLQQNFLEKENPEVVVLQLNF